MRDLCICLSSWVPAERSGIVGPTNHCRSEGFLSSRSCDKAGQLAIEPSKSGIQSVNAKTEKISEDRRNRENFRPFADGRESCG
jgi:hypothetical protein